MHTQTALVPVAEDQAYQRAQRIIDELDALAVREQTLQATVAPLDATWNAMLAPSHPALWLLTGTAHAAQFTGTHIETRTRTPYRLLALLVLAAVCIGVVLGLVWGGAGL